jgi:Mn-dependent DtxR family transcriptional regulator
MSEPNWDDWRVQCEGDDPLRYALPVGYDGEIVEDVFNVMRLLRNERPVFFDKIAATLALEEKYVHLILEVLADKDMTEYGTSPRGSWLTDKGEALLAAAEKYRRDHR